MKNKQIVIAIIFLAMASQLAYAQTVDKTKVQQAVDLQLRYYPAATLQDFYKSCFQDAFGPEHLMSQESENFERSRKYLVTELERLHAQHLQSTGIPYYEQVGYKGNFYRVSLELVEDGVVPFDVFSLALQRSVRNFQLPPVEAWHQEWREVIKIDRLHTLYNYSADAATLDSLLLSGQYAYHHSRTFNDVYHPHYRLIEKQVFEDDLLPYLTAEIPYEICNGYFVRNDVDEVPLCIYSQTELEAYFGMAAVMGPHGSPTTVDFNESYLVAVTVPETNVATSLKPFLLKLTAKGIFYGYEIKRGELQSYTTRPLLLIKVARKYRLPITIGNIESFD